MIRLLAFARRRARPILTAAGALGCIAAVLVSRISFDPDVLKLLPREGPALSAFETFLSRFGSLDHLYIRIDAPAGTDVGDYATAVDAYAERLRHAPEVSSVDSALFGPGVDWSYLFDRELQLLGPEGARQALGRLQPGAMAIAFREARDLLTVPSARVKPLVQQDPLGLLRLLEDRLGRQKALVNVDPTAAGYVTRDGRSRLLIVRPAGPPFDTAFAARLLHRVAALEADGSPAADPAARTGLGDLRVTPVGAYRVAVEAEHLIRRETIVNSLSSLAGILLLVLVVFRTPYVLLLGVLPLGLAALVSLAAVGAVTRLAPATSGSSAMLFGLGIDGVVLLHLRYLEERGAGAAPGVATRRLAGSASSVVLANVTTAASFLALLFIDVPSLNQLGWLVGAGILACCGFTLLLVPALLAVRRPSGAGHAVATPWLGAFVTRHSRAIIAGALAVTVLAAAFLPRLRVNTSLERLQANTAGTVLERDLAHRFGLPEDVLIALQEGPALEPLLARNRALIAELAGSQPSVATSSVLPLLPSQAEQAQVAALVAGTTLDPDTLETRVRAAAEAAGFRPDAFAPFAARLPRLLDPAARITYDGLLAHGFGDLLGRYVARDDGRFMLATYLYPEPGAGLAGLARALARADPAARLTGAPVVNEELGERFPVEFVRGVTIGTLAVGLLVWLAFRRVSWTLLSLLPLGMGAVWAAGLLAAAGVEMDLFSLFAALTVIGVAVDYGIHVLHRRVVEGTADMQDLLARTGAAILVAWATTLVGFGSLAASSYAPLRSFGIVAVTAITTSLVCALVVLPAILLEARRP